MNPLFNICSEFLIDRIISADRGHEYHGAEGPAGDIVVPTVFDTPDGIDADADHDDQIYGNDHQIPHTDFRMIHEQLLSRLPSDAILPALTVLLPAGSANRQPPAPAPAAIHGAELRRGRSTAKIPAPIL